jgi:hemoglobin
MSTLLEQLGGRDAVEAVVAGFYEKVLADATLAPFFRQISMSRQHQHQVDFFVTVLGGANVYKGRDMVKAHAGMGITDAHFDSVAGHLVATLKELGVPDAGVQQVVALVAPLREQIVERRIQARVAAGR